VPRSRIPDLLARSEAIAADHEVTIGSFGHAGDGNLHPTLVVPRGDDGTVLQRALAAFDDLVLAALDLGGTITGEHGVGSIKAPFLEREIGAGNLAIQRRIKRALDPHDLLNPGRWL
jgi:glycolate oxidase